MKYFCYPIILNDENKVFINKDIEFINTNHKKQFQFWKREKDV